MQQPESTPKRPTRIIYVEDDDLIADVVKELLTEAGYLIGVVGHGTLAYDTIAFKKPDLVTTLATRVRSASVRDISQRQAVEREVATAAARLYENNRLFAMAASLANLGHWHVDLVANEVIWADEVYRIHAVDEDHIPSLENGIHFYHPDDRERVRFCCETLVGGRFGQRCRRSGSGRARA